MVAQFLGLKLRLMANMFRRSPWQIFGMAISLLYGLGIVVLVATGLREPRPKRFRSHPEARIGAETRATEHGDGSERWN